MKRWASKVFGAENPVASRDRLSGKGFCERTLALKPRQHVEHGAGLAMRWPM
jgi:hypothetical protein